MHRQNEGSEKRIYIIKGEELHILTNSNTGINIYTVQELIQGEISKNYSGKVLKPQNGLKKSSMLLG